MFLVEDRYWWYRGMRRIARALLPELYGARPGLRVLDAGCGTGANLADMEASGRPSLAVGIDLSLDALVLTRRRGATTVVLGSATRLPFRDGSFDALGCRDVLYTVSDDAGALRELRRVARPGAPLLVTVAAFEGLRGEHDEAVHTVRRYRWPELRRKLVDGGWRPVRSTYANSFLAPPIFLVRAVQRLSGRGREPREDAASDFRFTPGLLDNALAGLLGLEAWLIRRRARLPFGVTLAAVARK